MSSIRHNYNLQRHKCISTMSDALVVLPPSARGPALSRHFCLSSAPLYQGLQFVPPASQTHCQSIPPGNSQRSIQHQSHRLIRKRRLESHLVDDVFFVRCVRIALLSTRCDLHLCHPFALSPINF